MNELTKPEIQELIENQNWTGLRESVEDWRTPEIADLLVDMEKTYRILFFRALPKTQMSEVFSHLEPEYQNNLLIELTDEEIQHLLANLAPDDRTTLLSEIPGQITQRLLNLLNPQDLREATKLLGYPEESVGRLMTPDYVAVRPGWTIRESLAHIRKIGKMSETINVIYVTDTSWKLLDALDLKLFILTEPDRTVQDIMDDVFISISAFQDREETVQVMQKYDKLVLPVVDSEGVLIGIVTIDDVLDVAEEEATEDFQKMGGVSALDTPYMAASVWTMFKKRSGWLAVLFLGQMLTTTAMENFEAQLESIIVLALFIPLIISSGGNSGSQATSLIIRAMAVSDVFLKDWWVVMRKEALAGLMLGFFLAVIGIFRVLGWQWLGFYDYGSEYVLVALTVSVALVGVVSWGSLVGSMLPFILRRIGFDPATSSAPFVATFVDVTGLLIYFGAASVILSNLL
ncbi:MAG: magnesium transporter [Balneolaceae bacterium]|nr:MAG: magnesium transporter [Balneolaceae bacterium]